MKGGAIHNALAYGFYAKTSSYFSIENTIFHGLVEKGVMLEFTKEFNFTNNVISYLDKRQNLQSAVPPTNEAFQYFKMGSESIRKAIRITDNRIYGYIDVAWVASGPCETTFASEAAEDAANVAKPVIANLTGDFIWANNFAMSGNQAL